MLAVFLSCLPYSWSKGFQLNPELADMAMSQSLAFPVSTFPGLDRIIGMSPDTPDLHVCSGDSNSVPPICVASALTTEPYLQFSVFLHKV